ncbi:hypothetical protein CRUP_014373 [Coryphaenoides rupestris]|nr:hypothetical protein CRUP_014373 [Coryphaenoides rupestris]
MLRMNFPLVSSEYSFLPLSTPKMLTLPRWLPVPEADVRVQGAGGSDGPIVADVHGYHAQLVALQVPLELQLLVRPERDTHSEGRPWSP